MFQELARLFIVVPWTRVGPKQAQSAGPNVVGRRALKGPLKGPARAFAGPGLAGEPTCLGRPPGRGYLRSKTVPIITSTSTIISTIISIKLIIDYFFSCPLLRSPAHARVCLHEDAECACLCERSPFYCSQSLIPFLSSDRRGRCVRRSFRRRLCRSPPSARSCRTFEQTSSRRVSLPSPPARRPSTQ